MSENRYLNPAGVWRSPSYSHVVETRASRLLYLSGQVPVDELGQLVAPGDMAGQAEQVFQNIGRLLAASGASFADVVKLTFFLADVRQMQAVRTVRDRYFPDPDRMPASSALGGVLLNPDWLLEVEVIAALYD
jgi:enamine deaminase RidA (YjgF/YER057c/UK114 family)